MKRAILLLLAVAALGLSFNGKERSVVTASGTTTAEVKTDLKKIAAVEDLRTHAWD